MKKWLLLTAVLLVVLIACTYIFIPFNIAVSGITIIKATRDGTFRILTTKNDWQKWWSYAPGERTDRADDTTFKYKNYTYNLTKAGSYSALVSIQHENKVIDSKISLLQFSIDSIAIMWQYSLQATVNPFERIKQYTEAVQLKNNITEVLSSLKAFVEKDENIYGIRINEVTTKDSFLISKKQMFTQQPSMNDVYTLINDLKEYAAKNNCLQTDAPMLNILHDSDKYRVMVALPINKEIKAGAPISFIKMVNGNFMTAQVQGGLLTVQNALQQMQLYFDDYDKISMAITFQYLVTDRIKETDTTKWITKIYAPVL